MQNDNAETSLLFYVRQPVEPQVSDQDKPLNSSAEITPRHSTRLATIIDNLDVSHLAIGFDRDSKTELNSSLELIKVAAAVRSSGRLKKLGRSASLPVGCSETRATQKRSWKKRLGAFRVPGPGYRESNPVVRLLDKRPVQNVTTADVAKLIVMNEKTSALAQAGQQMRVGRVADETP